MAFNESEPESPRLINLKKLEEDVERDGRSDYFRLRKTWSRALICFLAVMISFQIGLTIAIGRKWLSFMEYQYVLGLIVGENFLQVVSMCIMVVAFLFPSSKNSEKKE